MVLDSNVWGPHYWFVLLTIAISYPKYPNDVTKKKYYELIQNFPLFIPNSSMGNYFSSLLDKYPIAPYLDSRDSFIKWVHFIHNRVNEMQGKDEMSLTEAMQKYYDNYKPKGLLMKEEQKYKRKLVFFVLVVLGTSAVYYMYKK
jgi:hypothetical protein